MVARPCNNQNADITSGAALGGNGGFATVKIDGTFTATCPAPFRCFGNTVSVSIIEGASVPGGVKWTVTWFGTKTVKGVIHFADDYATSGDFTAIAFTKANKCTTTKVVDCWESVIPSAGNTKPASVTAIFYTDGNGKGGGFN